VISENLQMLFASIGCAGVIAAVSTVFFSMEWRHNLHKKNKNLHRILLAVFFGILCIYGTVACPEVDGVVCNCRNIAPLYAGLVGGPISGIGAGVIGFLFRWLVTGGETAVPCGIACITSGIIGAAAHLLVKKQDRYSLLIGFVASLFSSAVHMLLVAVFGYTDVANRIYLPDIIATALGMMFCLYMYKSASYKWKKEQ